MPEEIPVPVDVAIELHADSGSDCRVSAAFVRTAAAYENGFAFGLTMLTDQLEDERLPDVRGFAPPGEEGRVVKVSVIVPGTDVEVANDEQDLLRVLSATTRPACAQARFWVPALPRPDESAAVVVRVRWPAAGYDARVELPSAPLRQASARVTRARRRS